MHFLMSVFTHYNPWTEYKLESFMKSLQDDEGLNYHQEAAFGTNSTPGSKVVHESREVFDEILYTL